MKDVEGTGLSRLINLANKGRKIAFKAKKLKTEITGWIDKLLYNDFTPERIVGRLLLEGNTILECYNAELVFELKPRRDWILVSISRSEFAK